MTKAMETVEVAGAYGRWASIYDLVFGPVFRKGRLAAVEVAEETGGKILEVGVGTGLSLPSYRDSSALWGIDISEPMLDIARRRVERLGLHNVRELSVMDAENLSYPDKSFDVVVAQYVVTAVPRPEKALDEFVRVVRDGGEIVITTRVGAERGLRSVIERWLMPLTSRLGFRTQFSWSRYTDWAANVPSIRLIERRLLPPLGHFSLVRYEKLSAQNGI